MDGHFYLLRKELNMPIRDRAMLLKELVSEDPGFVETTYIKNQMALINSKLNPNPGCQRILTCGEDVEMLVNVFLYDDFDPHLDKCLVIEFIAYQQAEPKPNLNYAAYKQYLDDEFEITKRMIHNYSPYTVVNDEYLYISSETFPPISGPWECIEILTTDIVEIDGFEDLESTDLAAYNMNCDPTQPSILMFGQFMKVIQLIIGLKIVEVENGFDGGWVHNSQPFMVNILEADFYCMYRDDTDCGVKVHMLVDYLHQVVFTKSIGGVHSDECKSLADTNAEYPFIRRSFMKYRNQRMEINEVFEDLLDDFVEAAPTIYEMGADDVSIGEIIDWENGDSVMDRYF